MGQRGPKPQPVADALLKGNPGKRRVAQDAPPPVVEAARDKEPQLAGADLTPPPDLKGNKRALEEWNRLILELHKKGVLTIGDRVVFTQYCKIVAETEEYEELVRKVGLSDAHRLGYVSHLAKLRILLRGYLGDLGLTPSSRRSVRPDKSDQRATVVAPPPPVPVGAVEANNRKRKFRLGVVIGGQPQRG